MKKIAIPIHDKVGEELRYTLRGIAKYATGYSDIVLIGSVLPAWVQGVEFVEVQDLTPDPYLNQYAKCLIMEEDFILFNDDFYLTADTNFEQFTNKWFNSLNWRIGQARMHSAYMAQLSATRQFCLAYFRSERSFELHCPMIIERQAMEYMRGNEYNAWQFRSISGNFSKKYQSDYSYDVHFKNAMALAMIPDWQKQIRNAGVFSGGSNFLSKKGKKMMDQLFPEKCIFEK